VGAGHSFSPIALTDDDRLPPPSSSSSSFSSLLVNLDRLDRVLELPPPPAIDGSASLPPTVHVEAGIRVHQLNAALLAAGWALENTGAIAMQSVAGATQTGTHGTGSALSSMSSQIVELTMVLANGTRVTCSETLRPRLFGAARVGLGALGVLTSVKLRVLPKFKLHRVAMPYAYDQLMRDLPRLNARYERLQWYYTPYTNNATLLLRIPVPVDAPIVPCWPGDVEKAMAAGRNITCTDWSFKALCHEADDAVLYTEMEYFVDVAHAPALAREFRAYQDSVRNASQCALTVPKTGACSLFTGVRYGKADNVSWMSQFYQREIAVVSNIVLGTTSVAGPQAEFALFGKGLERIATKFGGRPHWGKMNWATAADLRPQYPKFDDFKAMREALDPHGIFVNNYLRRVLGLPS
jgi:L-gulonolactone oxidase